jgi:hypothetical protein
MSFLHIHTDTYILPTQIILIYNSMHMKLTVEMSQWKWLF